MTRSLLLCPAFAALLALGSGCAAQTDASSKRLNELNEQVRRLQATTDRLQERLSALENARVREVERAPQPGSAPSAIPELPVVKLQANADSSQLEQPSGAAETNEPRPLIVGEGSRIETRTGNSDSGAASSSQRRAKEKSGVGAANKRPNVSHESGKKSP